MVCFFLLEFIVAHQVPSAKCAKIKTRTKISNVHNLPYEMRQYSVWKSEIICRSKTLMKCDYPQLIIPFLAMFWLKVVKIVEGSIFHLLLLYIFA